MLRASRSQKGGADWRGAGLGGVGPGRAEPGRKPKGGKSQEPRGDPRGEGDRGDQYQTKTKHKLNQGGFQ